LAVVKWLKATIEAKKRNKPWVEACENLVRSIRLEN